MRYPLSIRKIYTGMSCATAAIVGSGTHLLQLVDAPRGSVDADEYKNVVAQCSTYEGTVSMTRRQSGSCGTAVKLYAH